jgi:aspartate kinase
MELKVFKFGGASVNTPAGVANVAKVLARYRDDQIVVVVSAMGKTTNALEVLLKHYLALDAIEMVDAFNRLKDFHVSMARSLFPDPEHPIYEALETQFVLLQGYLGKGHMNPVHAKEYNIEYDAVVSYGERFASLILFYYLETQQLTCKLFDAGKLVITDSSYRDARVNWTVTCSRIREKMNAYFTGNEHKVGIIQGFIGSDPAGHPTTLGREGSDYTAAIVAYALGTKEVTIWKDVPGVMNADPKWLKNAKKIDLLSYREAIELAFYGASVIHPKTIKPLENANITLKVKSFLHPEATGTSVENLSEWTVPFPLFIRKQNQVLITFSPRDFSFILEESLSEIFSILATNQIRVNVMQNSAISFSICVDEDPLLHDRCMPALQEKFQVLYNRGLELVTIRHYNQHAISRITKGRKLLLEQKTRTTVHLVLAT